MDVPAMRCMWLFLLLLQCREALQQPPKSLSAANSPKSLSAANSPKSLSAANSSQTPGTPETPKICNQHGCNCTYTLGQQMAECIGIEAIRLTSEQFLGGNITELRILSTFRIHPNVTVESDAFRQTSIRRVLIEGFGKATLMPNSFRITSGQPDFTVDLVQGGYEPKCLEIHSHAFSGPISRISIVGGADTSVPAGAFANLSATSITFQNVLIVRISAGAFEGSRLKNLTFQGCSFLSIEVGGVQPERVGRLNIDRCRFHRNVLTGGSFNTSVGLAQLQRSVFNSIASGSFEQIRPADELARLEFHDNRLQLPREGSLRFNAQYSPDRLSLRRLDRRVKCTCFYEEWLQGSVAWLRERLAAVTTCLDDDKWLFNQTSHRKLTKASNISIAEYVGREQCVAERKLAEERKGRNLSPTVPFSLILLGGTILVAAVCVSCLVNLVFYMRAKELKSAGGTAG